MGQSPTEMKHQWEDGDTGTLADAPDEGQSGADGGTVGTDSPVIGREWTDFAGANEYGGDLSAPEWDTPSGSATGREWTDFAGANEYRVDRKLVVTP